MNRLSILVIISLTYLLSCNIKAADIDGLIQRGDAAAHDDRHSEAITSYEAAIRLDQSARSTILPRLARQYLWSDNPVKAVDLFNESLQSDPHDCDLRMD